jgi:hypothetical protein
VVVINNKLFIFKMQEKIQFLKFKQLQAVRFDPKAIKRMLITIEHRYLRYALMVNNLTIGDG